MRVLLSLLFSPSLIEKGLPLLTIMLLYTAVPETVLKVLHKQDPHSNIL